MTLSKFSALLMTVTFLATAHVQAEDLDVLTKNQMEATELYMISLAALRNVQILCMELAVAQKSKPAYYDCAEETYNPLAKMLSKAMPARVEVDRLSPIKRPN